jgi:hypothetical protein
MDVSGLAHRPTLNPEGALRVKCYAKDKADATAVWYVDDRVRVLVCSEHAQHAYEQGRKVKALRNGK